MMSEFVVRRASWHYRLLSFAGYTHGYIKGMNFCEYWRSIAGWLLVYFIFASFISGIGFVIVYALIKDPVEFAVGVGLVVVITTTILGGVYTAVEGIPKFRDYLAAKEPGLIRTKYRSWKDKYCPSIKVE
jgi:hypothetical protein